MYYVFILSVCKFNVEFTIFPLTRFHLQSVFYVFFIFRINEPGTKIWIAAETLEAALEEASDKLKCSVDELSGCQDTDVLDTWFSSGIYPFAAFGWPDQKAGEKKIFFYHSF